MLLSTHSLALIADEDGSQVAEYAIAISLISVPLALALNSEISAIQTALSELAARVGNCLTSTDGTC